MGLSRRPLLASAETFALVDKDLRWMLTRRCVVGVALGIGAFACFLFGCVSTRASLAQVTIFAGSLAIVAGPVSVPICALTWWATLVGRARRWPSLDLLHRLFRPLLLPWLMTWPAACVVVAAYWLATLANCCR